MKKLIIISLIIATIITLGIIENVVTVNNYKNLIDQFDYLESVLNLENDDISSNEQVVKTLDKIEKKWNGFQRFTLAFANHNAVKDFSLKFSSLKGYISENDKKESIVCLRVLRTSTQFIIDEFSINYENIL